MRDIKFRAWDTVTKRFYSLVETHIAEMTHSERDGVVYMQYTGLKDKNDKEIYEGDIIKPVVMYDHNIDYFDGHGLGIEYAVRWVKQHTGFGLSAKAKKDMFIRFDMPSHTEHWEVVGNIYENSELLKDQ